MKRKSKLNQFHGNNSHRFIGSSIHAVGLVLCVTTLGTVTFLCFKIMLWNQRLTKTFAIDNSNQAVIELKNMDGGQSGVHYVIEDNISRESCRSSRDDLVGKVLTSEETLTFTLDLSISNWKFYQVCFSYDDLIHDQFLLKLKLKSIQGNCDMFVSAKEPKPSPRYWDWRSVEPANKIDELNIRSFSEEFKSSPQRSHELYIGIVGTEKSNKCILNMVIHDYTEYDVIHQVTPMLRGKVLLPRDIERIKQTGKYS